MKTLTTTSTKTVQWRQLAIQAIILLCALLFIYTATDKLLDYGKYVAQMQMVPLPLMQAAAPILGLAVPLAELAVVALLFTDRLRKIGLISALALMCSFEIYIGAMLLSGIQLPCPCGGLVSTMDWSQHLIFNATFIVLLAFALYQYIKTIDNAGTGNRLIIN